MIHGTGGMSVLQSSEQFTGRRTVHRKTLRAEWTTQIRWRQALQVLAFLLFLAVFLKSFQYLWREIDAQHLELAWQYLHDTTWRQILLACLFVAIAYGAHIVFELLAWTLVRAPMRVRTLSRIALIGAGITNALGQYWLSGSAVRLRLYRLADVPISHMVQVTAFVFSSIWIGYLLVAGFLTAWLPESRITIFNYAFPAEAMALIGLGVPAVYLVWAASKRPLLTQLHPPALSTCLAQITASLIRVFAIAGAFYALAPTGAALHYVDVVSAFTGAMLAAAIGQVPGALGVLEGTMVASIGDNAPVAAMLAALIAFRVIFYLIPLGLAAGAFAAWEIRGARASGRATARDASPASSPTDASVHHDDRDTQAQFLGQHALQHAEAVLHAHPRSKAYLALLGDKEFMFDPAQHAFLMFGRCGRSWICLGDPVGPSAVAPGLINSFIHQVRADGGRPVFHEVGADYLAIYLGHDLAVVKIAEEARIRLSAFSLEGHSHQTLRNAVRSAERKRVTFELLDEDDIARSIEELWGVSNAWRAARKGREKRFSMGGFDPAYIRHFRVVTGRWNGALVAFVTVWSGHSTRELFVDLIRVRPEAPRGTMDYLIVQLIRWAQSSGFELLNLGMAPVMAAPGSWHRPSSWPVMLARQFGERFYHFRGLRQFKDKFTPDWRARYLVAPPGISMLGAQIDLARLISGGWTGLVARG